MAGKPKVQYKCLRCKDSNWLIQCKCGNCNNIIFLRNKRGKFLKMINGHQHWKGGRRKLGGYWQLWLPEYYRSGKGGRVHEHIYFYEQYYKVCILPGIDVNHIDGNPDNNMPWNLVTMKHGDHTRYHNNKGKNWFKKDMSSRRCKFCNSLKSYTDKKGYIHWYGNEIDGWICYKCH